MLGLTFLQIVYVSITLADAYSTSAVEVSYNSKHEAAGNRLGMSEKLHIICIFLFPLYMIYLCPMNMGFKGNVSKLPMPDFNAQYAVASRSI